MTTAGAPIWNFNQEPETDTDGLDVAEVTEKQRHLEAFIGEELVKIAGWAGERGGMGDKTSLTLLARHMWEILKRANDFIDKGI